MKAVAQPCASKPSVACALLGLDLLLGLQSWAVKDRVAEALLIIDQLIAHRRVRVERDKERVRLRNILQTVHPVGYADRRRLDVAICLVNPA